MKQFLWFFIVMMAAVMPVSHAAVKLPHEEVIAHDKLLVPKVQFPDSFQKLQTKVINMLAEPDRNQRLFKTSLMFDNFSESLRLAREELLTYKVMSHLGVQQGEYQQEFAQLEAKIKTVVDTYNEAIAQLRGEALNALSMQQDVDALERKLNECEQKAETCRQDRESYISAMLKDIHLDENEFEVVKSELESSIKDLPKLYKKIFPGEVVHLLDDEAKILELKQAVDAYALVNKRTAAVAKRVKYACAAGVLFSVALIIMAPTNPVGVIPAYVVLGGKLCAVLAGGLSVANAFYKTFQDDQLRSKLEKLRDLHVKKMTQMSDRSEYASTSISQDGKKITFEKMTIEHSKQVVELTDSFFRQISATTSNMRFVASAGQKLQQLQSFMQNDVMSYVRKVTSKFGDFATKIQSGITAIFSSKKERLP